jgi:hypothetical protein
MFVQLTRKPQIKRQKSLQKQEMLDINQVFGSTIKAGVLDR